MKNKTLTLKVEKNACIETVAKRAYWNLVLRYMENVKLGLEDKKLEDEINLLKRFLEEKDIAKIRSKIEDLMEKNCEKVVNVVLSEDEDGKLWFRIVDEDLDKS
ncbi:MAG: hypothetical protein N3E48_02155 [Candidatus Bathyarchaeota archaeon]|nr:hypothetical protein [Candidatus Bathyarchaeota archaeon]